MGAKISNGVARSRGIAIHLIAPTQNLTLDKSSDANQVVGFNSKHVLQLSDAKKRTNFGSSSLRSQLSYGSDLGIDIVDNSGSNYVFSLTNYLGLEKDGKQKFINVVATALADQISRTEYTNECVCHLRKGLIAEELCLAKESKILPPVVCETFSTFHNLTSPRYLIKKNLIILLISEKDG